MAIAPDATCPHCGMVDSAGNITQHARVCFADPDVRLRVLTALTDPTDPTRAVSGKRYNAQCASMRIPAGNTLLKRYGTWSAVCAAFGLTPPVSYQEQLAQRAQNAEAFYLPCPHCGERMDRDNLPRHERVCVRNPAVRDAILSCLRDPQQPAHAVSAERYNARRVMFGAPSDRAVSLQYDGSWETVYRDFGLERPLVYNRKNTMVTCPHCAQEMAPGPYERHAQSCPKNPDFYDAIRAALQDDEYPEFAVALLDYHERARAAGATGVDLLERAFGGWRQAVEYFGLKPANSDELLQRREMAKVLAVAAYEAAALREDDERAHMLHGYNVRDLPGVTVNGRPVVAVMLR